MPLVREGACVGVPHESWDPSAPLVLPYASLSNWPKKARCPLTEGSECSQKQTGRLSDSHTASDASSHLGDLCNRLGTPYECAELSHGWSVCRSGCKRLRSSRAVPLQLYMVGFGGLDFAGGGSCCVRYWDDCPERNHDGSNHQALHGRPRALTLTVESSATRACSETV